MDTGQILADILVGGELKIHLIGVAGSGMSGIAGLLLALGHGVSGSDKARTLEVDRLVKLGLSFQLGQQAANVSDADLIIFSSAIRPGNSEYDEALRTGRNMVVTVTGEGGSGGALAIGVCDRLMMLQYSTYSVISPEGCASILWRSADKKEAAAEALGITAGRLKQLGLIDELLEEPLGGAHRDPVATAASLKEAVIRHLDELTKLTIEELLARRAEKIAGFGVYSEDGAE